MAKRGRILQIETEHPTTFAAICRTLRDGRVQNVETFSPVPPPTLGGSTGRSRLPWICLAAGLLGGGSKIFFQFWASAVAWPIDVGGRPWKSWPAFIPLTFEIFVLAAGSALVGAFFYRNRLWPGRPARPEGTAAALGRFLVRCEVIGPPAEIRFLVQHLQALGARVSSQEGGEDR